MFSEFKCTYESIRLLWNKVPITYPYTWKDVVVTFQVKFTTEMLSINEIPNSFQKKHDIILDLHSKSYSNKEISKHLNNKNIKTPHGKDYYPSLVWSTIKKLKLRDKRLVHSPYKLTNFEFWFKAK